MSPQTKAHLRRAVEARGRGGAAPECRRPRVASVRASGDHTAVQAPRILLLKIAALGDVVMASTMIGAARRRWPGAHITWAVGRGYAPVVRRLEGVDAIIELDEQALLRGGILTRSWAAARFAAALGRKRYDVAVVAHQDPRYARLLALANVGELRTMAAPGAVSDANSGIWIGEDYARLIHGAETSAEPAGLAPLRAAVTRGQSSARRDIVLAPGGARNPLRDDHLRRWPLANWVELATRLASADNNSMLWAIGSAADRAECAAVAEAAPAENLAGATSLDETMDRIARASLVITHDSGPLHLAMLLGTPAIALFGPTDPRRFLAPAADVQVASAAKGLACAPCYDGHGYAVCSDNRCLGGVSAERVAEIALARLTQQSVAPSGAAR